MKNIRCLTVSMAAVMMMVTTPVYASTDVITLLPYPAERSVDENTRVLTLEQAFELARRNNSSIDALNDSLRFIEQQRRSLAIDFDNAWRFGHGHLDFTAANVTRTIRSIDRTISSAPANVKMMETASQFLTFNLINAIRGIEVDLILLRENIALQTVGLNHEELRNSLGVASDSDVAAARQDLQRSRANLRALEIGLNNQRAALNHLLGLPSGTDVYIEHELSLERGNISARVGNIHYYADRQTAIDPSIVVLRRQLNDAQFNYDSTMPWRQNMPMPQGQQPMVNIQANPTDRANMLNALENASRELRDATSNMRENIRLTYNRLLQLEEQRETLLIDLRRARDIYDNAVVSLAAGMITEHEVNMARLGILSAEADIIRNAISYENLLFAFDFPFLLDTVQ